MRLKPGLILTGAGLIALLIVLLPSITGNTIFGPCAPNTVIGMFLFSAGVISGGFGLIYLALAGLFAFLDMRLRRAASHSRS